MHSDPDEEKVLKTRFRAMTPEEKLKIAVQLNHDARKLQYYKEGKSEKYLRDI